MLEYGSKESETTHGWSLRVNISDFKKKKKIVSCFYCGPSRNRSQSLEHVEEVLDKNGEGMQIACGEFKIDLLNERLAARITLENLMTAQGLDLVSLREPTRETATSSTCIHSIYRKKYSYSTNRIFF